MELLHFMNAIVEQYSPLLLSHWEDRLDALSGFAAEWKSIVPGDEYVAGLWKSDLFRGLAWCPAANTNNIRQQLPELDVVWPPVSRYVGIQSWSWAAYHGQVSHFEHDWLGNEHEGKSIYSISCPLELVSVLTNVGGANPFARVNGGQLVLSNWSMEVVIDDQTTT